MRADTDVLRARIVQGLNKIGLAMKSREWEEAAGSNLSPTQGQILSLLQGRGAQRLSAVAEALAITSATASDAVSTLKEKKLVLKRRSPDDARALAIELTSSGRKRAAQMAHWPDFLATAVDALSPEEQLVFHRGLIKMIRVLQERRQIPISRMCVNCLYFRPQVHTDKARPHHCDFVDGAFGDRELRIDCSDFQAAPASDGWQLWVSKIEPLKTEA
jgi:DNA-binding MarR family transcriptional regulator